MTPQELHEACHEAMLQCPNASTIDDDTYFIGFGKFADIPKKGMINVVKFWRDCETLWESGYYDELPAEALAIFDDLEMAIAKAVEAYFGGKP